MNQTKSSGKHHLNEGHRKRLRQRFLTEDLETIPPHNLLELLLGFVILRKDTNPIAHRLLNEFGTVQGVLEAPAELLMKVEGVGEQTAVFLKCIGKAGKYYEAAWYAPTICFRETADFAVHLEKCFIGVQKEILIILYLNRAGKLLNTKRVTIGVQDTILLDERMIYNGAMAVHASHIVLAHNHPGGLAIPSRSDIDMTIRLCQRLEALQLRVLDHFIFAGADYVSMQEMGYLDEIKR